MSARNRSLVRAGLFATAALLASIASAEIFFKGHREQLWKQHDMTRPKPPVVEPAPYPVLNAQAPKDAIILFDGSTLNEWQTEDGKPTPWKITNGTLEIVPRTGAIFSRRKFGDLQLHAEWAAPNPPDGTSQDRGNSGIFLMNRYEIQVIDSYKADTYADGQAASIYGQYPPLANASRPPGEWQSFDIAFRRPRFDKQGKLVEPARVTVYHNGILVQNNEELFGQTSNLRWRPYEQHDDKEPIKIQDHRHPVHFRNIWVREIADRPAPSANSSTCLRPNSTSSSANISISPTPAPGRCILRAIPPTASFCSKCPTAPSR
jgi:hypothetical protein